MALKRIKSTWHRPNPEQAADKSLEEIAGALAFITWRIALDGAKELHGEGYFYTSDQQRVAVIAEFVAFLIQVADRVVYGMLEDNERKVFVNALAQRLAGQVQDNLTDLFGPGDYAGAFIATLNERLADYSEFSFAEGSPGYDFLRYFGGRILKIMGEDQTNRWVIDQIMERSAPEAIVQLNKSIANLFA